MGRGGRREGAGRPVIGAKTYYVGRVETTFTRKQIEACLNLLEEYQGISEKSSPTSPRFDRLRRLLSKYKEIKSMKASSDD